jgi:hypothetical protein
MITLHTTEPISITARCTGDMMIVQVNKRDYAVLYGVNTPDDVNLSRLTNWVEETYYSDDYLCDQYIPARLTLAAFYND